MFIDDEVANERLRESENLFARLDGKRGDISKLPEILPPSLENLGPPELDPSLEVVDLVQDLNASRAPQPSISSILHTPTNLNSGSSNAKKVLDNLLNGYAGRGTKHLSRDIQASIGTTAAILGTTKASRLGDVAISQAHSYERGYTGPVDLVDRKNHKRDLQDKIIEKSNVVVDIVFDRLLKTLDCMDDEKIEKVGKATELSLIARNLNGIITAATPKEAIVQEQSVHFHVWKPEMAEEAEYPVIEVNSEKEEKVYTERAIATGV